jgi:hypothetical protein
MAERRRPPRKPPPRRRPISGQRKDSRSARIFGGAALGGLLLVLLIVVVLVVGSGGGDDDASSAADARPTATATPTPEATRTPKPSPTPRPLTAAQRQQRDMAAKTVADRGFDVTRLRDFDARKTLQVLIGKSNSGNELAFFFVDGEYIGNDSTESSKSLTVRRGGDSTTAILRYAVSDGDPVDVSFRWDGTRLTPDPEIPPTSSRG